MSKLFNKKKFKAGARTSMRKDDKDGVYWQKIDQIKEEMTGEEQPFLKIYKTTVHVVKEKSDQGVGDETTHALFPHARYNFFERDCKALVKAGLGLSGEEADSLDVNPKTQAHEPERIGKLLLQDCVLHGAVLEVKVQVLPKQDNPEETFTRITYVRRVTNSELQETLPESVVSAHFPEGLPEDLE